jgi:DNA gyrase/topoisomerase IV subunit A
VILAVSEHIVDEEITKIIEQFYIEYGTEVNINRAIPSVFDGLKTVQRRILYVAHKHAKKLVKSAILVGEGMKLHPHGDSSIYSTIIKLVQQGLLIGKGNWGVPAGVGITPIPPAAMRYTECQIHPTIENLLFEYAKDIPMIDGELMEEPACLPGPVPIGIVTMDPKSCIAMGIGVGIRTQYPLFSLKDLLQIQFETLRTNKIKTIPSMIGAKVDDVVELLEIGKGSVEFKGEYSLDPSNREIVITRFPMGKHPGPILNKIVGTDGNNYRDESTDQTRIVIKCPSVRKYKDLIKKLDGNMTAKSMFDMIFSDHTTNQVRRYTMSELMACSLQKYIDLFKANRSRLLSQLRLKIIECEIIDALRKYIDEYVRQKVYSIDQIANDFCRREYGSLKRYDLTKKVLQERPLKKLFEAKVDTDEAEKRMDEINNELSDLKKTIKKQISTKRRNV